jgi:hydroxybutyrate-dimer hydrolase
MPRYGASMSIPHDSPRLALALLLALGCGMAQAGVATVSSVHRGDDDLLTAGLGLAGLRSPVPPAMAAPDAPTAAELRRRAIWSNWRGIADLAPGGGLGEFHGRFEPVPGTEHHALLTLPGARHPHRVMLQWPDHFGESGTPCLLVAASSGSRGVYGAIALAGGWGLPRGCAVAYTDKGAGTGWFDTAGQRGARLDGTAGVPADGLEFAPATDPDESPRVLFKHAHSGDNPEVDWGRHMRQAAEFALHTLNAQRGGREEYRFADMHVIAVGVSNGGGAVLHAAALGGDWLDAAVAVAPNVWAGEAGRPLFEVAVEAALLMPCALAADAFDAEPLARPAGTVAPGAWPRCASLRVDGRLQADTPSAQAGEALAQLRRGGWTDDALAAGALSVSFDLWRAVTAAYAAAYARVGSAPMPCGYGYAMLDADGQRRLPTASEHALWWSDSSGVPPALGVVLTDAHAGGDDPAYPGLRCLGDLWAGSSALARELRAGVAATRAGLPAPGLPLLVMHGIDDGLVPEAHTSAPYVSWAAANDRAPAYWRIHRAQHFDAFLGMPVLAARYVPLMPYAWHGLDAMWRHLHEGEAAPSTATVKPRPRVLTADGVEPLTRDHLDLP